MLNRMVTLADQSANGTFDNETDRANLQQEVEQLKSEIDRIADSANYNGINLLDGSLGGAAHSFDGNPNGVKSVEVMGGNIAALNTVSVNFSLSSTGVVDVASMSGATNVNWIAVGSDTVGEYGGAVTFVADVSGATAAVKAKFEGMTVTVTVNAAKDDGKFTPRAAGAQTLDKSDGLTLQIGDTSDSFNQMKVDLDDMHTKSLGIDSINVGSQADAKLAVDVIRKAINTVSDEMMAYTKNNILVQSAQAMLAQANQVPQGVLQLLQ